MATEQVLEAGKHPVDGSGEPLHLLVNLGLFFLGWHVAPSATHLGIVSYLKIHIVLSAVSVHIYDKLGSCRDSDCSHPHIVETSWAGLTRCIRHGVIFRHSYVDNL